MEYKQQWLDTKQPVIPQIQRLDLKVYKEWLNNTKTYPEFRLFKSDFLEAMTHSEWWWPAGVYGCFSLLLLPQLGPYWPAYIALGWVIWWFLEYSIHRWLFHMQPRSQRMLSLHFVFHGLHHKSPKDKSRLVVNPLLSLLVAAPLVFCAYNLFPTGWQAMTIGGMVSYVSYESCHFWIHHSRQDSRIRELLDLSGLRGRHLFHHFQDCKKNFTISPNPLDIIFRTASQ